MKATVTLVCMTLHFETIVPDTVYNNGNTAAACHREASILPGKVNMTLTETRLTKSQISNYWVERSHLSLSH